MLKKEWGAESNGKLPHLFIPAKTAALLAEFAVEDMPSAELQLWFLRLKWRTWPWAEHSDGDDDDEDEYVLYMSFKEILFWGIFDS